MSIRTAIIGIVGASAAIRSTPQGDRHHDCVVDVPESSTVEATDSGVVLHHADGQKEHFSTPAHCHEDAVAQKMAAKRAGDEPNQWIDEAGFTYGSGFSKMTGWNNIPDTPQSEPGTDYWFLGMQNNGDGPVNILQPVLTYSGGEWTAASWACCPSNISTTGPTIGPFKEGDQMYGAMTRTNGYTWKIDTVINGKTSTLNARVGSYRYTWAVATFEDYGVSQCSQLPQKAVIFDTVKLYDGSGSIVHPNWNPSGGTMCNGKTTIMDENTISIQHGSAPTPPPTPHGPTPTPAPTPAPEPSPEPTPAPTPSGQCHAISAVVTDDWCSTNCAAGFCPSDLCKCDGYLV